MLVTSEIESRGDLEVGGCGWEGWGGSEEATREGSEVEHEGEIHEVEGGGGGRREERQGVNTDTPGREKTADPADDVIVNGIELDTEERTQLLRLTFSKWPPFSVGDGESWLENGIDNDDTMLDDVDSCKGISADVEYIDDGAGKELTDNAIEASSKDKLVEWSSTTVTIEDKLLGIDDDWEKVTLLLFDNGNNVDNVNGNDPECSRSPFSPSNADIVIVWMFAPFSTKLPPFWIVE